MQEQDHADRVHVDAQPGSDCRTVAIGPKELQSKARRYWMTVVACTFFTLVVAIAPPVVTATRMNVSYDEWDCLFDESVALPDYFRGDSYPYKTWYISSLFTITAAWGDMSFRIAKLVDVSWDTVVGRGGQVLLTALLYKVLSQALLYSMETSNSSFRRFATTAFETGSFNALRVYSQDLYHDYKTRILRPKLLLFAFIFGTAYTIMFPTIISSITGYQANSYSTILSKDSNTLFKPTQLQILYAVIRDGSRINLTDNYPMFWQDRLNVEQGIQDHLNMDDDVFAPTWYILEYVNRYSSNVSHWSMFPPPNFPRGTSMWAYNSSRHITHNNLTSPTLSFTQSFDMYGFNGTYYDTDWLQYKNHAKCQSTAHYRWGFSLLSSSSLFIWSILTAVFALTMYAVWLQTYLFSRMDRSNRRLGIYRAAVDIDSALRTQLPFDYTYMSNEEIKKELKCNNFHMGMVVAKHFLEPRMDIMKQIKLTIKEKWWSFPIVVIFLIIPLAVVASYFDWPTSEEASGVLAMYG